MEKSDIRIRLMQAEDYDAVTSIDEKVLNLSRREYYDLRFDKLLKSSDYVPASIVAENEEGVVIGFIMGELYIGEYGISGEGATLDTLGVDPEYQGSGVGELMMNEFVEHVKRLGVRKINTLVGNDDMKLMRFFELNRFVPSNTINLERAI